MQNFAQMSPIKSYWMLQNVKVTAFTASELLRQNRQGRRVITITLPPRLGLIRYDTSESQWNIFIGLPYFMYESRNGNGQAQSPNYCAGWSVLTISVPEKLKNSIIGIPIILQTLDIND